uniref:Ribonuclease H2 subunit C n=1 Tax=Aceria tosichella TaxID=561515 RepID=A0A6G1SCK1_9ACAR
MSTPTVREIDLALGPDETLDKDRATCHLMPCSIEHKELNVKAREYFWPTIRELKMGGDDEQGRSSKHDKSIGEDDSKDPILLASFRGRPLQGRRVQVPAGYIGHIINKEPSSASGTGPGKNQRETAKIKKHFSEFTYWNWDELPSKSDTVIKALNWLQVAKAIHDPVE